MTACNTSRKANWESTDNHNKNCDMLLFWLGVYPLICQFFVTCYCFDWNLASSVICACRSVKIHHELFFYSQVQGHPTTVFCKLSVLRSKYCLEFSIAWGRLKKFRWPFHSGTIFEVYLINSLYHFLKLNFSHFTP